MNKSILFSLITMFTLLMGTNSVFAKGQTMASEQDLINTAISHAEMAVATAEQDNVDEAGQHARVAYGSSKEVISGGMGMGRPLSRAQSHIRKATISAKHGNADEVVEHSKAAIKGWKSIKF